MSKSGLVCLAILVLLFIGGFHLFYGYPKLNETNITINRLSSMAETSDVIGVVQYKVLTPMTVKTNYYSYYAMKKNSELNGCNITRLDDFDCLISDSKTKHDYRCNYNYKKNTLTIISNDFANNLMPLNFIMDTVYD